MHEKIQHEKHEKLVSNFIQLHKSQFQALGLPEIYWRDLYLKLKNEVLKDDCYVFNNSPLHFINMFIYLRYSTLETFSKYANVSMRMTESLATKQFV